VLALVHIDVNLECHDFSSLNNDDYSSKNLPTLRVTTNYRNKNKNKKQANKLNKKSK
jgi:hypothetical protein